MPNSVSYAGLAVITSAEYDNIQVSGSARMKGYIKAQELHVSGTVSADDALQIVGKMHVSGTCKVEKSIEAGSAAVSGMLTAAENVTVNAECKVSGSMKVGGAVKAQKIKVSGSFSCAGGVEADALSCSGSLAVGGLINAETINIELKSKSTAKSIGGSVITVHDGCKHARSAGSGLVAAIRNLNRKVFAEERFEVSDSIEGDTIVLENVTCPRVTGANITIGRGCRIGLVQASEKLNIVDGGIVERQDTER